MRFDLPTILTAERAGRAMALQVQGPVQVQASTSLAGAAALAAARHVHNLGYEVTIHLTDANAHAHEDFATMLEVAGCMDLPLRQSGPDGRHTAAGVWIDGTEGEFTGQAALHASEYVRGSKTAWDGYDRRPHGRDHPFLTPALQEDALPSAAIRAVDRAAIETYGLPGLCLMENAGTGAVARAATMMEAAGASGPLVVLVGYGNNGGDGLVVARAFLERGDAVRVLCLGDPGRLQGDAAANRDILAQAEGAIQVLPDDEAEMRTCFQNAHLIVDGIFGTGLARAVEGRPARAIEAVNAAARPVLALDIPSGLDADTGDVMGVCVRAAETVTFAAPKPGFWRAAGPEVCGVITLADIGCPRAILQEART